MPTLVLSMCPPPRLCRTEPQNLRGLAPAPIVARIPSLNRFSSFDGSSMVENRSLSGVSRDSRESGVASFGSGVYLALGFIWLWNSDWGFDWAGFARSGASGFLIQILEAWGGIASTRIERLRQNRLDSSSFSRRCPIDRHVGKKKGNPWICR